MSLTLLKYCEAKNTTVAEVARQAGLDPKWLYKVAKGQAGFSLETAAKIEAVTDGAVNITGLNKVRQEWIAANPKPEAGKKAAKRPFAVAEVA
jgi:transcriptional regulator with XRE-family HTH domain